MSASSERSSRADDEAFIMSALEDFECVLIAVCESAEAVSRRLTIQGLVEMLGVLMKRHVDADPDHLPEMQRLISLLGLFIQRTTERTS
jgi:hypothetical protein